MCHGTRIPLPWYHYPYTHGTPCLLPTYIHALIHLFYLFILLSLSLFILLSLSLLLFSSLLLSLISLSPCHWQGLPLGRGSRSYLSCASQYFILFNYYPAVYMYCMVCMYLHVLYSVCVRIIYYTCIQQKHVCTQRIMYCSVYMRSCVCVVVYMLCCIVWTTYAWHAISVQSMCITYILYIVCYLFFSMFVYK